MQTSNAINTNRENGTGVGDAECNSCKYLTKGFRNIH